MKKLEFETSKGKFVLVDGVGEDFAMDLSHVIISNEWFVNLKKITENQAAQIVESGDVDPAEDLYRHGYRNYNIDDVDWFSEITSIESLNTLFESIYLLV